MLEVCRTSVPDSSSALRKNRKIHSFFQSLSCLYQLPQAFTGDVFFPNFNFLLLTCSLTVPAGGGCLWVTTWNWSLDSRHVWLKFCSGWMKATKSRQEGATFPLISLEPHQSFPLVWTYLGVPTHLLRRVIQDRFPTHVASLRVRCYWLPAMIVCHK